MRRTAMAMTTAALVLAVSGAADRGQAGPGPHAPGRLTAATGGLTGKKTVEYGGYVVDVPAAWPVYDLAAQPHLCVRYDRHAVYLGHPGPDQRCPAHLVGRTDAVRIDGDAVRVAVTYQRGGAATGAAQRGSAQRGSAQRGSAQRGSAQRGSAQRGSAQRRYAQRRYAQHRYAQHRYVRRRYVRRRVIVRDTAERELGLIIQHPRLSVTAYLCE